MTLAPGVCAATDNGVGTTIVRSGHSALWFDPARNGEGWQLEILGNDRAALYWFTYDAEGNQRWLFGTGDVLSDETGQFISFPELLVSSGGQFGADFDPDDVSFEVAGDAVMSFSDCDSGQFAYSAFDQSQVIDIQRLTHTMASGCESINGPPGFPVKDHAGQSGSWFDPTHTGEGFALQWLSRNDAAVTWYTYDDEGNQYWMTGVGQLEDSQIVFSDLISTRGARFGQDFDPEDVEPFDWGTLTLDLSCTTGTASYESDLSGFGIGSFSLTRLTQLVQPVCPYVQPNLTDLYEITWNEIPIEPGTSDERNNFQVHDIANDGTIAAIQDVSGPGEARLALWRPTLQQWEILPRDLSKEPAFISADGDSTLASEPFTSGDTLRLPLRRDEETGWKPLSNLIYDESSISAVSQDFTRVAGEGKQFDERNYPWVWDATSGQRQLPVSDSITHAYPAAVANQGETVIGTTLRFANNFPTPVAVRWPGGGNPHILTDHLGAELLIASACDHDCQLIFGSGQFDFEGEHPHLGQAFIWRESKPTIYLGNLPDALPDGFGYFVDEVAADGSLAAGDYFAGIESDDGAVQVANRGFIWTQRTGLVSVRALVEELGIGDDNWESQFAVSVSPDGRKVLLRGKFPPLPGDSRSYAWRAVVLELIPKA